MEIALRVHVVRRILSNISVYTGPIFTIFSPDENALRADEWSWQPNNVETNEKVMKVDSYHLYALHWHLKTNWNIIICMCASIAAMIRLHVI